MAEWEMAANGVVHAKFPRKGRVQFIDGKSKRYGLGQQGYVVVNFNRQFSWRPEPRDVVVDVLKGWIDELQDMIDLLETSDARTFAAQYELSEGVEP